MPRTKATIAITTGDPAGIGPEISLKAALDPTVRAAPAASRLISTL
jgi:4-hydroxy-L-threonine phosphate dehydrogenase PdxA